ncbi:MAG: A/G-specific adenine glycosylase [Chlamydiota bacterium]
MKVLNDWFLKHKRDLPWRKKRDPYATWIAEVMLQQTGVLVVIPYFERWMKALPDIHSLAAAPKETVLKLWEGLGYYSRARNLLKGAIYIVEKFQGNIPSDRDLLQTIPGIGPYTSAAIATFSFGQKIAAVDANVARFISRFLALEDKSLFEQEATKLLPDKDPWIVAEAMIEMGATICRKKPDCLACPVQKSCLAFLQNRQYELPLPTKRAATTYLEKTVIIICFKDHFLLKNPEEKGVMADLWEFPTDIAYPECIRHNLPIQKHSFTRYSVTLTPYLIFPENINFLEQRGFSWYSIEQMKNLTFSAGHKRILNELENYLKNRLSQGIL